MTSKFVIVAVAIAVCCTIQPVESEEESLIQEIPGGGCFGFELLITKLEILEQKLAKMEQTVEKRFFPRSIFQSCSQEPSKISGTYLLLPDGNEQAFEGFCEQVKYGGGWLVVQYRFDGSVDFYRDWAEYKDGFGKVDGEHWIGLERLHKLTKNKNMTLMVEFVDIDGNYNYASYNSFAVGNEDEKYELKRLGEFAGSTGDSMRSGEKQRFTTRDSDNDKFGRNCARDEGGAWWYAHCGGTNPNGPFRKQHSWKNIYWMKHRSGVELKFFRMMIRQT